MDTISQLRQIKPMQIITIDYTPYYIYTALFILILILGFILYFFINKSKVRLTTSQKSQKYLKNMDFKMTSKNIAYNFTIHAKICLNIQYEDDYNNIVNKLVEFKYKKDVKDIPKDLIKEIKEYIRVCV